MILALDINSKRTGFAFGGTDDGAPRSGVWNLPGADDLSRCCGVLASSMAGLCRVVRPAIVVIEAPLFLPGRTPRTALILYALYGVALAGAHQFGARTMDANVSTWRAHFLGKGNLNGDDAKRLALARCQQFGWQAENHDQAEACGIWAWAMAANYPKWAPGAANL